MACIHRTEGCTWVGEYNQLSYHLQTCEHDKIPCPRACGAAVNRHKLQTHLDTECDKCPVPCRYCYETYELSTKKEHEEQCPKIPIPCPFNCNSHPARADLPTHLDRYCDRNIIPCIYKNVDCDYEGPLYSSEKHMLDYQEKHLCLLNQVVQDNSDKQSQAFDSIRLNQCNIDNVVKEIQDLKTQNTQQEEIIKTLIKRLDDGESLIKVLIEKTNEQAKQITAIEEKCEQQDLQHKVLEGKVTEQQKQIKVLEEKTMEQEREIKTLEAKNEQQDLQAKLIEEKIIEHEGQLTELETKEVQQDMDIKDIKEVHKQLATARIVEKIKDQDNRLKLLDEKNIRQDSIMSQLDDKINTNYQKHGEQILSIQQHMEHQDEEIKTLDQQDNSQNLQLKHLRDKRDGLNKEMKIMSLEIRQCVMKHNRLLVEVRDLNVTTWVIDNICRKIEQARNKSEEMIYSVPFFSRINGHKLKIIVYLNGEGKGKSTHVSVFYEQVKGDFDELFAHTFNDSVTFCLQDQDIHEPQNHVVGPPALQNQFNSRWGYSQFISHEKLYKRCYIKDDKIILQIAVNK